MEIHLILDNIRSVHNVGSIFRTADAAGVSMIYLIGTTPAPVDRFGRVRKDFMKVSLGAERFVRWEQVEEVSVLVKKLKKLGFTVVALEQDKRSITRLNLEEGSKTVLIIGNEVGGVSRELLDEADHILEIPMRGKKESLNVAVATGIALFGLQS